MTVSHIAFSIPFVAVIVRARVSGFDHSLDAFVITYAVFPHLTVVQNVGCGLKLVGESSGEIGIAVRREKVRLDRAAPGGERVRLKGRIDEVAYYGNTSHLYLENATGVPLSVTMRNEARTTVPTVASGDELWMSWDAADTLVLTS